MSANRTLQEFVSDAFKFIQKLLKLHNEIENKKETTSDAESITL